jgi:hypothetical protein
VDTLVFSPVWRLQPLAAEVIQSPQLVKTKELNDEIFLGSLLFSGDFPAATSNERGASVTACPRGELSHPLEIIDGDRYKFPFGLREITREV